jgi:two-component system cell cycle response regulator DivK
MTTPSKAPSKDTKPLAGAIPPNEAYVLVVEDNLKNFVLVARLLAYLGVKDCQWKASGWQVVEFADSMPRVDLVLLDIHIPDEDGYAVLARLKSDPRFQNTRIVAVTADSSQESMLRAKAAGFDGFIGKPLDPDEFPNQVRQVLQGKPIWVCTA